MESAEKTKYFFPQPIFFEIGKSEDMLREERVVEIRKEIIKVAEEDGICLGAIVVDIDSKEKHIPTNWGVIIAVHYETPLVGDDSKPVSVRWFNGHYHQSVRHHFDDFFCIKPGVTDLEIEELKMYNED